MHALADIIPAKNKIIVIGHSYGGPVALQLAIDYPDRIKHMMLLAPAISPDLVNIRWYNRLASLKIIKAFLPTPLNRSNDEMLLLKNELQNMQPNLHTIKAPTLTIQGQKDWIVLPGNATFAKKSLINAPTDTEMLPNRGHFIPWEEYTLIKNKIIEIIE